MNQPRARVKRSRKSAPKSRQGCITCKSRHVKCDETRPFCKRCDKAGLTCQGFPQETDESLEDVPTSTNTKQSVADRGSFSRSSASSGSTVSSAIVATSSTSTNRSSHANPTGLPVRLNTFNATELRFLEFFYKRTAPAISGYFDAKFYNRVLLQSGQSEPAIRHGMVAVAAMHQHFEQTLVPSFGNSGVMAQDERPPFALYQYNKAISAINQSLSSGPGSIESVLMCCLLFVSLECLRGDTASAISHLKAGGNIIANWKTRNRTLDTQKDGAAYSSVHEIPKHTDTSFVNEHLVPIFERLSCHVDGVGRIASSEYRDLVNPNLNPENPLSDGFLDLDEARAAIMNLGSVATRFVKSLALSKYVQDVSDDDLRVVAGLQAKFAQWDDSMESLFSRRPELRNTRRATVLQVQQRLFFIATATGISTAQCANDYVTKDYEYLLNKADQLIGKPSSRLPAYGDEEDISLFSLEEGVSPACFFVATHCRVPHLRRKAVELLHHGPARQGIWNAVLLARVAQRQIDLEENFTPRIQLLNVTQLQQPNDPLADAFVDSAPKETPLTPKSMSPLVAGECTTLEHLEQTELPLASNLNPDYQLPPEEARIHHADIKESIDGTPHKHTVTFYRMPNGLTGDWDVWTEDVVL